MAPPEHVSKMSMGPYEETEILVESNADGFATVTRVSTGLEMSSDSALNSPTGAFAKVHFECHAAASESSVTDCKSFPVSDPQPGPELLEDDAVADLGVAEPESGEKTAGSAETVEKKEKGGGEEEKDNAAVAGDGENEVKPPAADIIGDIGPAPPKKSKSKKKKLQFSDIPPPTDPNVGCGCSMCVDSRTKYIEPFAKEQSFQEMGLKVRTTRKYMEYIQHLEDRLEAVEKIQAKIPPEPESESEAEPEPEKTGSEQVNDESAETKKGDLEPEKKPFTNEIRFRVDYLSSYDPDAINVSVPGEAMSFEPQTETPVEEVQPAIEVRKKIVVRDIRRWLGLEQIPTHIVINSTYLANAIRTIVRYYPSDSLNEDTLMFREPYPLLYHHLSELENYAEQYPDHDNMEMKTDHINLLLKFLRKSMAVEWEAEKALHKEAEPKCTFKNLWMIFRPGCDVVTNEEFPRGMIVRNVNLRNRQFFERASMYEIECWYIAYDGEKWGRVTEMVWIPFFTGSRTISALEIYPAGYHPGGGKDLREKLEVRGLKVFDLHKMGPSHIEYNGATFAYDYHNPLIVDSRCVIDAASYHSHETAFRGFDDEKLKENIASCDCKQCRNAAATKFGEYGGKQAFVGYESLDKETTPTPHQCFLITNRLYGWVLKDRRWGLLNADHVSYIVPNKDVFENLILPEGRTDIIKALVQSHMMKTVVVDENTGTKKEQELYSADAIKGKGQGLLVLLHGAPGVGKTSTAECVAEYTSKPLFPITCGDIGIDPSVLEKNLQQNFRFAHHWNAILLLDEADVFLQRRELDDLARNSLVSVFLRILEYYKGILFLTTNRVGTFDEAFTSRIHAIVYYPPLGENDRVRIWENHLKRFEKARQDVRVAFNVTEYLHSDELRKLKFNGRQIRNLFQTAVSLALFEAKDGRPRLQADHLQRVVRLSLDFQKYLEKTRASDSLVAKEEMLRRDDWSRKPRRSSRSKKYVETETESEESEEGARPVRRRGKGKKKYAETESESEESEEEARPVKKKGKGRKKKAPVVVDEESEEEERPTPKKAKGKKKKKQEVVEESEDEDGEEDKD